MTRKYSYESFEFSSLTLPSDVDEDTDISTLRSLSIYAQVKPEEFDATTISGFNEILDELKSAQTYKATEKKDSRVLGVASFQTPQHNTDYLFIEGIAVHKNSRGMELGVYIIDNIVEIALKHGKIAIEGNVRPTMEPYYEKRGWDYVDDANNSLRMRYDIR